MVNTPNITRYLGINKELKACYIDNGERLTIADVKRIVGVKSYRGLLVRMKNAGVYPPPIWDSHEEVRKRQLIAIQAAYDAKLEPLTVADVAGVLDMSAAESRKRISYFQKNDVPLPPLAFSIEKRGKRLEINEIREEDLSKERKQEPPRIAGMPYYRREILSDNTTRYYLL